MSSRTTRRSRHDDYTMACICPMAIEFAPVEAMLDERHAPLPVRRDYNKYSLGRIGPHNIVITVLPEIGNNVAAIVANQLLNDFPSVQFCFLVGIGGGLPGDAYDLRLGDVVVGQPRGTSSGVIQYDRGKVTTARGLQRTGALNKPPAFLLSSVQYLRAQNEQEGSQIDHILTRMWAKRPAMLPRYGFPGREKDLLFQSTYPHNGGSTCDSCDASLTVQRHERQGHSPNLHYGIIGSANTVLKDSMVRDELRNNSDMLCVEMEGAGVLEVLPCLIIRGICDYADSHKNKDWQPYAAAAAAAYLKTLLLVIPSRCWLDESHTPGHSASIDSRATDIGSVDSQEQLAVTYPSASYHEHIVGPSVARLARHSSSRSSDSAKSISPLCRGFASQQLTVPETDQIPTSTDTEGDSDSELSAHRRRYSTIRESDGHNEPMLQLGQLRQLLDLLQFNGIDRTYPTLETDFSGACSWLLDNAHFKRWLDPRRVNKHGRIFWIKEKSAAGKSTLIRDIIGHIANETTSRLVLAFIFNVRGGRLERCTEGMYRSLLFQLLKLQPDLCTVFPASILGEERERWDIYELQLLLSQTIERLDDQALVLLVDAIDWTDEKVIRDVVSFFKDLVHDIALRDTRSRPLICFSSRHDPEIRLEGHMELVTAKDS